MKLIWLVIVLSILGIFDTAYLTAERYLSSPVYCPIGGECDKVLTSPYATIYGVPLALFGLIFYFFILVLALGYQTCPLKFFEKKFRRASNRAIILKIFFVLTLLAFIFSGWLVYLQLFVIKAICVYCVISAINVAALFIISIYLLQKSWNN